MTWWSPAVKSRANAYEIPCKSTEPKTIAVIRILTRKEK